MKILVVSQYFWPENFRINDLVSHFSDSNYSVVVLTGKPNYPEGVLHPEFSKNSSAFESYGSVEVCRVPMLLRGKGNLRLLLNYLSFFLSASTIGVWKLRKYSFDIVFVFGASPISVAIPAILQKKIRKIPVVLWVLDLWPESLSAVGAVKSPVIIKFVGLVVTWIYNNCDRILIQSRSFFPSIKKYCSNWFHEEKIRYFPSWAEDVFSQDATRNQQVITRRDDLFTILFAGNIGEAQDFPSILNAVELLRDNSRVRWVIVGDGRMYDWMVSEIESRNLSDNIKMIGRFPLETMPSFFECADVLLVSLKTNDIFARTIPGKLQSYLAAGKPVVAMIDGEAKLVIESAKCGRVCSSGDYIGLANAIDELAGISKESLAEMGRMGREYYQNNFDRKMLFSQLEEILKVSINKY